MKNPFFEIMIGIIIAALILLMLSVYMSQITMP